MNEDRISRVLEELKNLSLRQMLITDPHAILYLTGVDVFPHERFFGLYLNTEGRRVLFLNDLFNVSRELDCEEVWYSDTDDLTAKLMTVIDKKNVLGVDKDMKARFLLPLMCINAALGFVNASFAVDITRGVKGPEEQTKMREVSHLNDLAMAEFKKLIHEGVTEKEVESQMLAIYKRLGCQGYSFDPIVSFGKNAADPHHEPDDTVLKEGDCVLFDVGGIKDGWCADMTRTFYYKFIPEHARQIYDLVARANAAGEAAVKPGVKLADVDRAARSVIEEAGYGVNFNHRLGHFIGMDVHEFGDVSGASTWVARPGMIFSCEPGIYLAGDTGVRIEDLVLVTEDGCEILNHYPHEPEVIG